MRPVHLRFEKRNPCLQPVLQRPDSVVHLGFQQRRDSARIVAGPRR